MRKFKFLGLFSVLFLFSILIVSCGGKKKSNDDSSTDVQTQQNNVYYDVEFKNYNGDLLYEASVKEGTTPEYQGENPIRPDEADAYYTFKGWSPALGPVDKKATYVAQFEKHDCTNYTITFKDDNGKTLYEGYVRENTMPSYPKGTPTKANDDEYSYTFKEWSPKIELATGNATYVAQFDSHELPYNISIDLEGGSSVNLNKFSFKTDKLTSDMLVFDVNKSGYAFRGYELNGTKIFDEYGQEVANISLSKDDLNTIKAIYDTEVTLTIKYSLYNPLTNKLVEESISVPYYAVDVSESGKYECNTTVDLYAEAADDYSFAGWYYNGKALSNYTDYNYMMWEKDLTIEARFIINPYTLAIKSNKFALGEVGILGSEESLTQEFDGSMYMAGDSVTILAYTKGETRFLGWYELTDDGDYFVSPNAVYSFIMPKKDYTLEARWELTTLTTKVNNTTYGTLSTASLYNKEELEDGTSVSLTCTAKTGYYFAGWYEGSTLVSSTALFTYKMPKRAVTLVAVFKGVTITLVNDANVTTTGVEFGIQYQTNKELTINATNNTGKKLVWYYNDTPKTVGDTYQFTTKAEDVIIRIISVDSFEGIGYTKEGTSTYYFGRYPSTKVANNLSTSLTNTYATTLPTSGKTTVSGWTSYNYYSEGSISHYMWYKDVDTDEDGLYDYRGVYFTKYRPKSCFSLADIAGLSSQDENGYSKNTVYWFSYDSIKWTRKKTSSGKAYLITFFAIDAQDYIATQNATSYDHNGGKGYANNYALSNIRKWLNDTFYNTAFTDFEKAIIKTTTVDNSGQTTQNDSNQYACDNTEDKLFLISFMESAAASPTGLFDSSAALRKLTPTEYTKCQGVEVTSGYCSWYLRSPYYSGALQVHIVNNNGDGSNYYAYYAYGVRPACWIEL